MIWLASLLGNEKLARRIVLIGGLAIGALVLLALVKCSYDRRVIAKHEAAEQAAIAAKTRPADAKAAAARETTNAEITADQQEIEHATGKLPDAPLTDRQRARACVILMRQAREAHRPEPSGC